MNGSARIDMHAVTLNSSDWSCVVENVCPRPIGVYSYDLGNASSTRLRFYVPKLFLGCSILQSVLISSLECFFNQTCTAAVNDALRSDRYIDIDVFPANSSRFAPETTTGAIVDELMIETWNEEIRYERYFAQCASKLCTYEVTSRSNPLYVITATARLSGWTDRGLEDSR